MRYTFPVIILIGRPAAGKSEVIDYLKKLPEPVRRAQMHIGPFEEIDDFVWVWQLFEDDDVRQRLGRERQNTSADHLFNDPFLWDFLIGKINLAFEKKLAQDSGYLNNHTILVEFARGGEDGFAHALSLLSEEILKRAAIMYVSVPYEESVRRNRRRARPGQEDSILYHSLSDAKMEILYKISDWDKLSRGESEGTLTVRGHTVPFAVFQNEPEKTDDPAKLGPALRQVFDKLWTMLEKL